MTLASTLKQRQDILRDKCLEFQLEKIPFIQKAIKHTAEHGNPPDFPITVVVESLKVPSLFPPSNHKCIGYEFLEKNHDGEYHIYRKVIKGINQFDLEDIGWTIKGIFDNYNNNATLYRDIIVYYE